MTRPRLYKKCNRCAGTGKLKIRSLYVLTADTKRMLRIMKKHELTQFALAKILEISQGTVSGWLHGKTNKIKPIYFANLKAQGYF